MAISINSLIKITSITFYDPSVILVALQLNTVTQPAITCSKVTIETLKQGVKFVQN